MEMNDWIILVTALGGIEGIKQLVKWWVNRKTDRRISDAQADVEEFKTLREYNEFLQKQLSEKEQRFVEQTDRLRKVQDELFTLKDGEEYVKVKKVEYEMLGVLAIEGVKMLKDEIEKLKAEIETLKNKQHE